VESASVPSTAELQGLAAKLAPTRSAEDSLLLILVSPRECFACSDIMQAVVRESRRPSPTIFLILTSPPNPEQQTQLQLQRVPIAAVLPGPEADHPIGEAVFMIADSVYRRQPLGLLRESPEILGLLQLQDSPMETPPAGIPPGRS
jgi:hypothetical protein